MAQRGRFRRQETIADDHAAGVEEGLHLRQHGIRNHFDRRDHENLVTLLMKSKLLARNLGVSLEHFVGQPIAVDLPVLHRGGDVFRRNEAADLGALAHE